MDTTTKPETPTRRDELLERDLDEIVPGAWKYDPALVLTLVDVAASLSNQSRFEPLDDDTVARYRADMEAGDEFPPLLVWAAKKGPVILGGNHRYAAATQADLATHPAYVVDCDEATALVLTYADNRRHGLQVPEDEKLTHAAHLIDLLGWSAVQAARMVGVDRQKLTRYLSAMAAQRRARDLNLDAYNVPTTVWTRLSAVRLDLVFAGALELYRDGSLNSMEIGELVGSLNRAPSEEEALRLIEEARQASTRAKRGKAPKGARHELAELVVKLGQLSPNGVSRSCMNADQRLVSADRCDQAVAHLTRVAAVLREDAR